MTIFCQGINNISKHVSPCILRKHMMGNLANVVMSLCFKAVYVLIDGTYNRDTFLTNQARIVDSFMSPCCSHFLAWCWAQWFGDDVPRVPNIHKSRLWTYLRLLFHRSRCGISSLFEAAGNERHGLWLVNCNYLLEVMSQVQNAHIISVGFRYKKHYNTSTVRVS